MNKKTCELKYKKNRKYETQNGPMRPSLLRGSFLFLSRTSFHYFTDPSRAATTYITDFLHH